MKRMHVVSTNDFLIYIELIFRGYSYGIIEFEFAFLVGAERWSGCQLHRS